MQVEHHAYYFEGSQSTLGVLAQSARELFHFTHSNDPDVRVEQFEKFGIEDAQRLKEQALFKPISGRALFVVGISSITTEAQQALLKLFEEPQRGIIFVLLVPHGALIQTLRSRMLSYPKKLKFANQKVLGSSSAGHPPDYFAHQISVFLKSNSKDRSDFIVKLLKDEEGQKERVREFINALEVELSKNIQDKKARQGLEDVSKVRSYVSDRSPSLKMLLEHLALSLPTQ